MNIQEIKTQLEELTTKVNELEHSTSEYTFTKEEMIKFITQLNEQFVSNISNILIDAESIVELDFNPHSRTIDVSIIGSALSDIIEEELESIDEDNIYINLK